MAKKPKKRKLVTEMSAEEILLKRVYDKKRKQEERARKKELEAARMTDGSDFDVPTKDIWKHNREIFEKDSPKEYKRLLDLHQRISDAKELERYVLIEGNPLELDAKEIYQEILDLVKEVGTVSQFDEWLVIPNARKDNFEKFVRAQATSPSREWVTMGLMTKYPLSLHANYDAATQTVVNLQHLHDMIHGTTTAKTERVYELPQAPSEQEVAELAKHIDELADRAKTDQQVLFDQLQNGAARKNG